MAVFCNVTAYQFTENALSLFLSYYLIWFVYRKTILDLNINREIPITLCNARNDPPPGKGWRLRICIKKSLTFSPITIPNQNRIEVMDTKLGMSTIHWLILCIHTSWTKWQESVKTSTATTISREARQKTAEEPRYHL